jgi:hypothetical protein
MSHNETESIQRALNDAKKRELEEKYGGTFHSSDPNLPPDIEADWLRSIEEFERQFSAASETTVRRFIGNPVILPLSELSPEQLRPALDGLLTLLESNNVIVHFDRIISDREAYRFLTEELLDHEMDDIRIEGMTQNFLYEEFHPDDRHDAAMFAEVFLRGLFAGSAVELREDIAPDGTPGPSGRPVEREALVMEARDFRKGIAAFIDFSVNAIDCSLEAGVATVRARLAWEGLSPETLEKRAGEAAAAVTLRKDECGAWPVVGFQWLGEGQTL